MSDPALVTGAFADFLDANRAVLNQQVAAVARQAAGFDADAYATVLRSTVPPVVDAVDRLGAGFVSTVSQVLVEVALDLCAQRRFDGPVCDGWEQLLPRLAPQLVAAPRPVVAAVTNALDTLGRTPGARPQEWIDLVSAAAVAATTIDPEGASPDELLRAGQVAAWRSGMAAYRSGALAVAATLPPPLLAAALGTSIDGFDGPTVLDRLRRDPWFDPGRPQGDDPSAPRSQRVAVGSFRGFGGPFVRPPLVTAVDDRIVASDGVETWNVFADGFGSAVVRGAGALPTTAPPDGPRPDELADIAELTSWVRVPGALAATSALGHAVLVSRAVP